MARCQCQVEHFAVYRPSVFYPVMLLLSENVTRLSGAVVRLWSVIMVVCDLVIVHWLIGEE